MRTTVGIVSVLLSISAGTAWSQALQVTNVVNFGQLDTKFGPASVVIIYGTFPQGAGRNFSITVGGQTGLVSAADNTAFITAEIPTNAPTGAQTLTVNYNGSSSNAYPITIAAYAPEFESNSVQINSSTSQPVFQAYPPFSHSSSGQPVTASSPAQPGETLIASVSGLGQTNPATSGEPPASFTPLAVTPTMTVSNISAPVSQAGSGAPVYSGAEVFFQVPGNAPSGNDPVVLTIGGISSAAATLPVGSQAQTFFTGASSLGNGVYYLQFPNSNFFGFYNNVSSSIIYHYDMGFEAYVQSNDAQTGIYFYDFTSGHWLYSSPSLFPYLYDFSLNSWLYYIPATNNPGHYSSNPRYFSNLTTQKIITM